MSNRQKWHQIVERKGNLLKFSVKKLVRRSHAVIRVKICMFQEVIMRIINEELEVQIMKVNIKETYRKNRTTLDKVGKYILYYISYQEEYPII